MSASSQSDPVLAVDDLTVSLLSGVPIIQNVSLRLAGGEILGIVGESGSGKSTLALAILGYTQPGASITEGSVAVSGEQLVGRPEKDLRRLRGRIVAYVPKIRRRPSIRHSGSASRSLIASPGSRQSSPDWFGEPLERAQLPTEGAFSHRFPHQLSGGQQQRVMIAMAVVGSPPLIVLDEPTTGLDVITQSGLLDEMAQLRDELHVAMIYVSHDIAAVASIADSIAVMYAGRIVEQGSAAEVLQHRATRTRVG